LKAASYPVTIDPTIYVQPIYSAGSYDLSQDAFVSGTNPNTNYNTSSYLHAGNHSTYGTARAFIKFRNLPSLPPSAKITEAYLGIYMYLGIGPDATVIDAHQVTSDWQADTVTWTNKPAFRATPEYSIADYQDKEWTFNITSLVRRWYSAD